MPTIAAFRMRDLRDGLLRSADRIQFIATSWADLLPQASDAPLRHKLLHKQRLTTVSDATENTPWLSHFFYPLTGVRLARRSIPVHLTALPYKPRAVVIGRG